MKKTSLLVIYSMLFFLPNLKANEGMWLPILLSEMNEKEMQEMGFKLTLEDIYSINKSSMKDAVVRFGRGCTGELISGQGLVLTNHHCGYGSIQSLSSVENDYLTNGFWSMDQNGELPVPGLTITFIVRIEDVTKMVLQGIEDDMEAQLRENMIAENIEKVKNEAIQGTHYAAQVRPFYYGSEYYLFVTETYRDIRLVGTPPSSIGKFGGDTDNWMWPRHTGDFSIFRVYAGKDNLPADYSEDNVPFQPRHFFPLDIRGVKPGDFTMIYGFPGSTQQYLPSYAVEYVSQVANPAKIAIREQSLSIMDAAMKSSDTVRIKYAARYASISNYYKKWQGENNGLKKLKAIQKKREQEKVFMARAQRKASTREYAQLVTRFEELYTEREKYALANEYFRELVFYGPEVLLYAYNFINFAEDYEGLKEEDRLEKAKELLERSTKAHFKDYDAPTDQKLLANLLRMYIETIDPSLHPEIVGTIKTKYEGSYEDYASEVFGNSTLIGENAVGELLEKFAEKEAKMVKKDPAYELMMDIFSAYQLKVLPKLQTLDAEIEGMMRQYVAGMRQLFPEKEYWSDANSTLRVSYGKVEGSIPRDGMSYLHYTTMDGIMEKYQPGDKEFDVPGKLMEIYEQKDYGEYAQDGEMWVCFTASNHTTGGNSGSPVVSGEGHLIGINFDRSWESTMSDIMFDPERCRNIAVDIRYILLIIDKMAGAKYLLDEMEIIRG